MNHANRILVITIGLTVISFFAFCEKEKKPDNTAILALALVQTGAANASQLPQPAQNSAILVLDKDTFVLPLNGNCQDNNAGLLELGFLNVGAAPTLFIRNIDFTKNGTYNVGFDSDTTHGTYDPTGGNCPMQVLTNTVTEFEAQMHNCPATGLGGSNPPTMTVSFRVRCLKN